MLPVDLGGSMVQFYALSVVVNLLIGLSLSFEPKEEKQTFLLKVRDGLREKGIKFTLGLTALVVGVLKILSPIQGDVPVVGDIVPVITGIALGGILLVQFFKESSDVTSETVDKLFGFVEKNRKYVGIVGVVSAILHFLMPRVPIL